MIPPRIGLTFLREISIRFVIQVLTRNMFKEVSYDYFGIDREV